MYSPYVRGMFLESPPRVFRTNERQPCCSLQLCNECRRMFSDRQFEAPALCFVTVVPNISNSFARFDRGDSDMACGPCFNLPGHCQILPEARCNDMHTTAHSNFTQAETSDPRPPPPKYRRVAVPPDCQPERPAGDAAASNRDQSSFNNIQSRGPPTARAENVSRNSQQESEAENRRCGYCGMTFSHAIDLLMHERGHRREPPGFDRSRFASTGLQQSNRPVRFTPRPDVVFGCIICGDVFHHPGDFGIHMANHAYVSTTQSVARDHVESESDAANAQFSDDGQHAANAMPSSNPDVPPAPQDASVKGNVDQHNACSAEDHGNQVNSANQQENDQQQHSQEQQQQPKAERV